MTSHKPKKVDVAAVVAAVVAVATDRTLIFFPAPPDRRGILFFPMDAIIQIVIAAVIIFGAILLYANRN